jgi:hypothetical protein
MSLRLKTLAALNVVGWLVALPLLLATLLAPIIGFDSWPDRLLPGGDDGTVRLAAAPRPTSEPAAPRSGAPAAPALAAAVPAGAARTTRAQAPSLRRAAADGRQVRRRGAARRVSASLSTAAVPAGVSLRLEPYAKAAEPVRGHGRVKATKRAKAPKAHDIVKAPTPFKAATPVKAARPVQAATSVKAPTPVKAATPVQAPKPVSAPKPVRAPRRAKPVHTQPARPVVKPPKPSAPGPQPPAVNAGKGAKPH